MLVISRRIGESFLIGEDIEATVVDITGEKVVLGIRAPKELAIGRTQIDAVTASNRAAAASGAINANSFASLYKKRFPSPPKKK